MISLRAVLERELARIAGLPVACIRFELEKRLNTGFHRLHRSENETQD
jgi:hypothetical protein